MTKINTVKFDSTTMNAWVETLRSGLQIAAPVVRVSTSTLGGPDRPTIMMMVSLDPRETWSYGILENSRYFRMSLQHDGTLENFSGHYCGRFRKSHVKTAADALTKIVTFIEKANANNFT